MGAPHPTLLQKKRGIWQKSQQMGQRGCCHYLHGIACLIRALVLHWTSSAELGTRHKEEIPKRLQTISISFYLEPLQVSCTCQLKRNLLASRSNWQGQEGPRGQRVPREIASVGWRKSTCSSTSLRSHREESRRCFGEVHSTFSSAGIRQRCAFTHRDLHKGGLARVSCPKHCPPTTTFFFSASKLISQCIRCDSRSNERTTWNSQITPIKCLSSDKSQRSCR